jgi:hypothetical protein
MNKVDMAKSEIGKLNKNHAGLLKKLEQASGLLYLLLLTTALLLTINILGNSSWKYWLLLFILSIADYIVYRFIVVKLKDDIDINYMVLQMMKACKQFELRKYLN